MKLFQRFRRRELTPVEQLAEYESEIAYNQSVIENSENSIQKVKTLKKCKKAVSKVILLISPF